VSVPSQLDPSADQEFIARRWDELVGQARVARGSWERFAAQGLLYAPLLLPTIQNRADRVVELAERMVARIDEATREMPGMPFALRDLRGDLSGITPKRAYRHIVRIATTFILVWPITMALLGMAVEITVKVLALPPSPLQDALDSLLGLNRTPSSAASGSLAQELARFALEVVWLFPGGAFFFSIALVYAVLAGFIALRAREQLRKLERRDREQPPPAEASGQEA
jgi:hypothetical protein